ncbi:RagB/SusD family nutrient uptake outer membrane protein [Pontibacter pudoricolor]|uniref:RagB/SusD family nutrient uptake outer membrane protein n=1 Tax=Pontibacter pudoricolor TaxID=2694930 RepID=UPI0013920A75|nr:RagB/SusD family nutrient uptake outer membrane protein [Pontibacter pudoricolor]
MKVNKYIKVSLMLAILGFTTPSCDDVLEKDPTASLSNEAALDSFEGIKTALTGAYSGLGGLNYYGRDFVVTPEVAADNVKLSATNTGRFVSQYNYSGLVAANGDVAGFWNTAYNVLARTNNVINSMDVVKEGAETERNQVLGEALFLRALVHHDLVRLFAQPYNFTPNGSHLGIPVVLKSELGNPARNTVAEVYTQIIEDLERASDLMTINPAKPFTASKYAAEALLSRVYLYKGDWRKAADAATAAVNGYKLVAGEDYVDMWSSEATTESIFEIQFLLSDNRGANNPGYIYIKEGYGDLLPTQDVLDIYEEGDVRLDIFRNFAGQAYIYKIPGKETPGLSNIIVLRLAEVLLNRAEALAELGEKPAALTDINKIRERAGVAPIGIADLTVDFILEERRRELAFEGHRLFDIKRRGQDLVREDCNLQANCTIEAGSNYFAYPIPQRELDANPNIKEQQNPGY